jgi:hypothetical protein
LLVVLLTLAFAGATLAVFRTPFGVFGGTGGCGAFLALGRVLLGGGLRGGGHGQDSQDPVLRVQIDPNVVFDEIAFDPHLAAFERQEREVATKNLGYTGPFCESALYQRVLLEVYLNKPPSTG